MLDKEIRKLQHHNYNLAGRKLRKLERKLFRHILFLRLTLVLLKLLYPTPWAGTLSLDGCRPSVRLSVCPSVCSSVCSSVCLFVCLSVRLPVSLSGTEVAHVTYDSDTTFKVKQAWTGHCAIVPWHRGPPSTNTGAPWPLRFFFRNKQ